MTECMVDCQNHVVSAVCSLAACRRQAGVQPYSLEPANELHSTWLHAGCPSTFSISTATTRPLRATALPAAPTSPRQCNHMVLQLSCWLAPQRASLTSWPAWRSTIAQTAQSCGRWRQSGSTSTCAQGWSACTRTSSPPWATDSTRRDAARLLELFNCSKAHIYLHTSFLRALPLWLHLHGTDYSLYEKVKDTILKDARWPAHAQLLLWCCQLSRSERGRPSGRRTP